MVNRLKSVIGNLPENIILVELTQVIKKTNIFVLSITAFNFLRDDQKRFSYDHLIRRKEEAKISFESSELVCQRQKTHKRFYSATIVVDHDFNRFIDESRGNFSKFLKHGKQLKPRPKVVSKDNMEEAAFEGYVEEGLSGFQGFIKSVPKINTCRY